MALTAALAVVSPAAATDLEVLRADAQRAADRVSSIERKLQTLEQRQAELEEEVDLTSGDLGALELKLGSIEEQLSTTQDRFVARAVEVYKSGSTSQLAVILSARTLADLADATEMISRASSLDAGEVDELLATKESVASTQQEIDDRKQDLLAASRAAEEVAAEMELTLTERRSELAGLTDEIERLEEQAREAAAQAAASSGISVGQALLDILTGSGPTAGIPDGFVSTGVSFEGLASWYGPGFEGNLTANGDVFDPGLYTAASKELPLGSWLYIEYEGKGVVVYVNDRGPYVGERILDLSRAAAEVIGLTGPGVAWVRAEILLKP
jgi:rare lipoprotein A